MTEIESPVTNESHNNRIQSEIESPVTNESHNNPIQSLMTNDSGHNNDLLVGNHRSKTRM